MVLSPSKNEMLCPWIPDFLMEMAEVAVVVSQDCGLIISFCGSWEAPGYWHANFIAGSGTCLGADRLTVGKGPQPGSQNPLWASLASSEIATREQLTPAGPSNRQPVQSRGRGTGACRGPSTRSPPRRTSVQA